MPLYEYQCQKCKHKFEKIQKFSDRPLKKCPECGGALEKVLHAAGLSFKGSGWYVNDYGGKKADPSSSSSSGDGGSESSASKATEKTDKKSDSKAEAKSESKSESKPEPKKTETKRGRAKR